MGRLVAWVMGRKLGLRRNSCYRRMDARYSRDRIMVRRLRRARVVVIGKPRFRDVEFTIWGIWHLDARNACIWNLDGRIDHGDN